MKKKNSFKWLLLFVIMTGYNTSVGQDNIVPASPEANALAKSINFPVGYNTGVPDIGIPLYQVKSGEVTIPLAINYNAGGFKINDRASDIGLGWSLSTNIQISRSIEGGDDFAPAGSTPQWGGYYYNNVGAFYESCWDYPWGCSTSPPLPTAQQLFWILENNYDRQPDRFYYSIPGKSGTFYWQKFYDRAPVAVTVPYNGIKIEYINTNEFKLTDTDGTIYFFGSSTDNLNSGYHFTEFTTDPDDPVNSTYATSWKCSKITSPSKADNVYFTYRNKSVEEVWSVAGKIEVYTNSGTTCSDYLGPFSWQLKDRNTWSELSGYDFNLLGPTKYWVYSQSGDAGFHMIGIKYQEINGEIVPVQEDKNYGGAGNYGTRNRLYGLLPNKITFRGGELQFLGTGVATTALDIKDDNGQKIKTIKFIQSGFGFGNNIKPTRYLDEVQITSGGRELEKYSFNYNKYIFGDLQGGDAWNGVNDYTESRTSSSTCVTMRDILLEFCPTMQLLFTIGFGGTDVHGAKAQSGILNRITYPTGGYTDFTFSPNMYKTGDGTLRFAGGLRVEKIQYYDGSSSQSASEKIYKYGEQEDGAGIVKIVPNIDGWDVGYKYYQTVVHNNGIAEQKTIYPAASVRDMSFASGAPVHYTTVTEYQKDGGQFTGKTVYEYDKDPYNSYNPSYILEGTPLTIEQSSWHMGQLKKEIIYKYNNGAYDWLRQKTYGYTAYTKPAQIRIEKVYLKTIREGTAPIDYQTEDFENLIYGLKVGTMLLTWEEEKIKESGKELTKTTNYYYDNTSSLTGILENLKPTRVYTTAGSGKTLVNYMSYLDATSKGIPFLPREMISATIENGVEKITAGRKMEYRNDGLLEKSYSLELAAPSTLSISQIQPLYKEKLSFSYDNRANVTQVTPRDNIPEVYIWDYNQLYPIASIKNATGLNEVAYTSFETDGTGGWSGINSTNIENNIPAVTGQRLYNLTDNNPLTRSGLNTNAGYTISYWSKNGSYTVNGSGGSLLRNLTINGENWNCYLHKVNNPSAGTITVVGNGKIDELRLYPGNATITTFSYTPLLGMSAQCDQNNRIIRYYYDVTRLDRICDENGNIIKKFCYNYQGQPEVCAYVFRSIYKSGTFTKQCTEGGIGSTVIYPVDEGAYTSTISQEDANQKAQNDVDTKGQAYANTMGICTWYNDPKTVTFTKNNCIDGGVGSAVDYDVPGNKYSSTISKSFANQQAQDEINLFGQTKANDNGNCTWYSYEVQGIFYNQNCPSGETAQPYHVTVPLNLFTSNISREDANQKALADAQNKANTFGPCSQKVYAAIDVRVVNTYDNTPTNGYKEVSVYLKFFDGNHNPLTLSHNVGYTIRQLHQIDYLDYSEDLPNEFFEGVAPAGVSEVRIGDILPFYDYWLAFDDDGNCIYQERHFFDYDLLPRPDDFWLLSPVNYPESPL
ncbi:MAG TPA: DUF5977 domain-containing protein [Niastella sp.]